MPLSAILLIIVIALCLNDEVESSGAYEDVRLYMMHVSGIFSIPPRPELVEFYGVGLPLSW
jgi:hypothetical protein